MKPNFLFSLLLLTCTGCAQASPVIPSPTPLPTRSSTPVVAVTVTATTISVSVCTQVQGGKLNVRASASSQAAILGVLDEASVVKVLENGETSAGWVAIQSPIAGWVKARFLCGASK